MVISIDVRCIKDPSVGVTCSFMTPKFPSLSLCGGSLELLQSGSVQRDLPLHCALIQPTVPQSLGPSREALALEVAEDLDALVHQMPQRVAGDEVFVVGNEMGAQGVDARREQRSCWTRQSARNHGGGVPYLAMVSFCN